MQRDRLIEPVNFRSLAHQTRLQPDMRVAHFTLEFRAWNQGGNGINDQNINGAGAN